MEGLCEIPSHTTIFGALFGWGVVVEVLVMEYVSWGVVLPQFPVCRAVCTGRPPRIRRIMRCRWLHLLLTICLLGSSHVRLAQGVALSIWIDTWFIKDQLQVLSSLCCSPSPLRHHASPPLCPCK